VWRRVSTTFSCLLTQLCILTSSSLQSSKQHLLILPRKYHNMLHSFAPKQPPVLVSFSSLLSLGPFEPPPPININSQTCLFLRNIGECVYSTQQLVALGSLGKLIPFVVFVRRCNTSSLTRYSISAQTSIYSGGPKRLDMV
jgi:hypothetical protein